MASDQERALHEPVPKPPVEGEFFAHRARFYYGQWWMPVADFTQMRAERDRALRIAAVWQRQVQKMRADNTARMEAESKGFPGG